VNFDTTLNVAWLMAGLCALAAAVRSTSHRDKVAAKAPRWLHVIRVGLIVAALFPYISATDDVLRIQHLNSQHDRSKPAKQNPNDGLMRLYEAMDSPLVVPAHKVAFTLFFVRSISPPVAVAIDRAAPFKGGRSPPPLLLNA
jgi:hypothetical protein